MAMWVLRHKATALHCLRAMISNQDPGPFEVTVATILSLIMAGVYYGGTQEWRCHLFGALEIASHRMAERPWIKSEMAWLAAQSLYLLLLRIKVDHGVDQPGRDATLETCLESEFFRSLSCRPDFGFTLGVSRDVALCLTQSVMLIDAWNSHSPRGSHLVQMESLTQRLLDMTLKESQPNEATVVATLPQYLAAIHNHIFSLGLLICLQRRTINPRPRQLLPYTTALFSAVALFMALSSGSSESRYSVAGPTIWPIFYAAVELFRLEDQNLARAVWLDRIESTAIGNRTAIRAMIEKILGESGANELSSALKVMTVLPRAHAQTRKLQVTSSSTGSLSQKSFNEEFFTCLVDDLRLVLKSLGSIVPNHVQFQVPLAPTFQ